MKAESFDHAEREDIILGCAPLSLGRIGARPPIADLDPSCQNRKMSALGRARLHTAAVVLAAVTLFPAASAASTGDGYFCVGRDYLAYEFEDGYHTQAARAGLYLVRLNGPDGFVDPVVYEFDPGKVRGMRCLDDRVQLLDDLSVRSVDLGSPSNVRMQREPLASGPSTEGFVRLNLGELSHLSGAVWPEDVALPTTSRFSYALAVIKTPGVPENHMYACYPASVTHLYQFDLNHNLVRSLQIAAGCDLSDTSSATAAK
jgi:hypothetical protein